MSERTIPGPELPAEATAREKILADLKEAFARGEEVSRGHWGIWTDPCGIYRPLVQTACCPIARQLLGTGATLYAREVRADAAMLFGVALEWIDGFLHAWDSKKYKPTREERPYFWGFAAGLAARELEPCALEGGG